MPRSWVDSVKEKGISNLNSLKQTGEKDSLESLLTSIEDAQKQVLDTYSTLLEQESISLSKSISSAYTDIINIVHSPMKVLDQTQAKRQEHLAKLSKLILRQITSVLTVHYIGFGPNSDAQNALTTVSQCNSLDISNIASLSKSGELNEAASELYNLSSLRLLTDKATIDELLMTKVSQRLKERVDVLIQKIDPKHLKDFTLMSDIKNTFQNELREDIKSLISQIRVFNTFSKVTEKETIELKHELKIEDKGILTRASEAFVNRIKTSLSQSGRLLSSKITASVINVVGVVGTSINATKAAISASVGILSGGFNLLKTVILELPGTIMIGLSKAFQSLAILTETVIEIIEAVLPTLLVMLIYILIGIIGTALISGLWLIIKNFVVNHVLPWVAFKLSSVFVI